MPPHRAGASSPHTPVPSPPADRRRKVALRVAEDRRQIETKRQRDGAIRRARDKHRINPPPRRPGGCRQYKGRGIRARLQRNETGSIRGGRRRGYPPLLRAPSRSIERQGGGLSVGYGGSAAAHRWQLLAPRRAPRQRRLPCAQVEAAPLAGTVALPPICMVCKATFSSSSMMLRVEQSPALAHPASRCGGRAVSNSSCERRGSPH